MDDQLFRSWKRQVSNLEEVLKALSTKRIVAVNPTPYPKVVPAVFMPRRSYAIYSVQDSRDADAMREFVTVFSLGERHSKVAEKVHALSFLMKNFHFQAFLKSRKEPVTLLFSHTSPSLLSALDDSKVAWAGYDPAACEKFADHAQFLKILDKYKLRHLPESKLPKADFLSKSFSVIFQLFRKPVRVTGERPGRNLPVGVVNSEAELKSLQAYIAASEDWEQVQNVRLQPEPEGKLCNLVACVTGEGVLTSGLHLPLPDFTYSEKPRADRKRTYGYVLNPETWPQDIVIEAQVAAELVGEDLAERGYVGVFGLEFFYEQARNALYITAFTPGFPPDNLEFSQKCLIEGAPPPEFFSLAAYFGIPVKFDFEAVNSAWKKPRPVSSIAFSLGTLTHMTMDLAPGAYRYNAKERTAEFLGNRVFLNQLSGEDEFLLFDSVLRPGQSIPADAPRSFKFFFRTDILQSHEELLPRYAEIVQNFANVIRGEKALPRVPKSAAPDHQAESKDLEEDEFSDDLE